MYNLSEAGESFSNIKKVWSDWISNYPDEKILSVSWYPLFRVCVNNADLQNALELIREMSDSGARPDIKVYNYILRIHAYQSDLDAGEALLKYLGSPSCPVKPVGTTYGLMIILYSNYCLRNESKLDETYRKALVRWTASMTPYRKIPGLMLTEVAISLIQCCVKMKDLEKAVSVYDDAIPHMDQDQDSQLKLFMYKIFIHHQNYQHRAEEIFQDFNSREFIKLDTNGFSVLLLRYSQNVTENLTGIDKIFRLLKHVPGDISELILVLVGCYAKLGDGNKISDIFGILTSRPNVNLSAEFFKSFLSHCKGLNLVRVVEGCRYQILKRKLVVSDDLLVCLEEAYKDCGLVFTPNDLVCVDDWL
eukprot:TRINITY_DN7798_c0_g2_i1.p1 TRINITY_DN7798_c0_g2~~TRINITY_DN7798_c0_g2_i1.p1  ORF type:complete len:362 (-),score=49.24 TRINITY_DN7798_c0_g2_i1:143-1228(-)